MAFLTEYALSIITVSLLALLLEHILPEGSSKKYTTMVIGLLVMLVILGPLTKLPHYSETFSIPYIRLSDNDLTLPDAEPYLARTFEDKLAETIRKDLQEQFGQEFICTVNCRTNAEGQITEIQSVQLSPYSREIGLYVAEKYGLEEGVLES